MMSASCVRSLSQGLKCLSLANNWMATQVPPQASIKGPGSAYAVFIKEAYPKLKRNNPNLKSKEIFSVAAKEWHTLSDFQKRVYQQKFEDLAWQHQRRVNSLTDEEKDTMAVTAKRSRIARKLKQKKSELSELTKDKPKDIRNPYNLYVKTKAREIEAPFEEKAKKISQMWKNLSETEVEKFKLQFESEKKAVASKMIQWKNTVAKDGRLEKIEKLEEQIKKIKSDM